MSDDDSPQATQEPTPPAAEPVPPAPEPKAEPAPANDPGPLETEVATRDMDPGQIHTASFAKADLRDPDD